MSAPSLPLILDDDGDLSCFDSVPRLECYLEPIDVPDLRVFDADGQRLNLRVSGERVSLTPFEPPQFEPDELKFALERFLEATGNSAPSSELGELVIQFVGRFGYRH